MDKLTLRVDGPFEPSNEYADSSRYPTLAAHLYSRSSANLPVTSPSVATMSARSGAISADTAAHPAMAVLCNGDVGRCPSYKTLLVAGPDAVWLAVAVESRREPSRRRSDARAGRSRLLRVTVTAVSWKKCELRDEPAGRAHKISRVEIVSVWK